MAARAVQGIGAAILMAIGPALIGVTFPGGERGRAPGLQGTATYVGLTRPGDDGAAGGHGRLTGFAGWLSDRIGPKPPATAGLFCLGLGMWLLARAGPSASLTDLMLRLAVVGVGAGLFTQRHPRGGAEGAAGHRLGPAGGGAARPAAWVSCPCVGRDDGWPRQASAQALASVLICHTTPNLSASCP